MANPASSMEKRPDTLVRPGIHLVPVRTFTLPPATHTNCYLLGGRELVIVDPGTPIAAEQEHLLAVIRRRLEGGARVREIWLTHHHRDHVGAVARLREELRSPVAAHALTADALGGELELEVDRSIADGESSTLALDDGSTTAWVALLTPGHARGHLCFHAPATGELLTGDNVVGEGTVLVAAPDGEMATYLQTLERLRELGPSLLLPGHGEPIAEADAKIGYYIAHRLEREASILSSLADGPLTPEKIVRVVYTDVHPNAYPLAELNVRTHLAKLVVEARVGSEGDTFWVV